ncbi:hypothetical protein ACFSE1_11515 [Rhizobium helianthi]|uniref:Secreted protein n=1 Tax=Rhizobium helianthi TaxID=1132695 RepID=A0ABW4M3P8_9HYPH
MRPYRHGFVHALFVCASLCAALGLMEGSSPALAQSPSMPAINWESAGQNSETSRIVTPQLEKPQLPDSGFDCNTVTRLSIEEQRLHERATSGPRKVQRCSRDGFSLELSAPQD